MRRIVPIGFLVISFLLAAAAPLVADAPPAAPVRNVVDEYWGVKVNDPYRYMANLEDSEVQAWIKSQAAHAATVLERIPGREELLARLVELDAGRPYRVFGITRMPDESMFYYRQAADENLARLYTRATADAAGHLLIDPSQMKPPDGGHYSISFYKPSPDGKYVAYGLAASGSEITTLRVLDVETATNLPDSIDRIETAYTSPQWLPDASGFFYARRRLLPPEAPPTEGYKRTRSFLHRLGADPEDDPPIFAMDLWPGVQMTEDDFPSLILSAGSDYVVGKIKHGDANQITIYAAPLATIATSDTPWKMVCDVPDSVTRFAVQGDQIYLLTSRQAPRFRLVKTSLGDPDFATATEVIPASDVVVKGMSAAKDALYVRMYKGGMNRIVRLNYDTGEQSHLKLPDDAPSGYVVSAEEDVDGVLLVTASWTKRSGTWAYDPKTDSFTDTGLNPRGKFDDVPGYESVEVEVPSHDGVMVPLSIIYKSGMKRDGSNPTLLGGYGAYGSSRNVFFSPLRIAWLERGGIIGVAHVRGGGEYGQEWHLGGQKTTKHNTWKDFIACAEYMIAEGYTTPQKLAGTGGSAGGILIGRAITERPDLFAAALLNVGCLDAVRMETTMNGVPNIQEFGTVEKEDEFHGLLAMSSYHHVEDGVEYPAVMLAHGINDPRVEPWMSAKMCARLQVATASDKPVLFRVDYQAGHGIGSTKTQYLESTADKWAFLMWQFGEEEFQP